MAGKANRNNKSAASQAKSAARAAGQAGRTSSGQDSRKVHDTKGKNNHGRSGGQAK